MLKRSGQIALVLIISLFLYGLAHFIALRFSTGEVFPHYSTLRSDPIGTKAFFESLGRLNGISVSRHLLEPHRIKASSGTTLFFLGLNPRAGELLEKLEQLAREGSRVVIALNAINSKTAEREEDRINRPTFRERKESKTPPLEKDRENVITLMNGLDLALIDPLRQDTNALYAFSSQEIRGKLPTSVSWYGRYCFVLGTNDWETIYSVKTKPVLVQKRVGLGSIVFASDSFLFSNEALLRERSPELLLWAVGPSKQLLFDEAHLGVQRGSGIMVVLREYRLTGLFAGFVLVAALWIWKSSLSFVPAYPDTDNDSGTTIEGKTAREGVVHLLERNISLADLPAVCLQEWRKSHATRSEFESARLQQAEEVLRHHQSLPHKQVNPVETYDAIKLVLSGKN
jgi:hypothetical protein